MAMKLYPPYIEGTIPAFCGTTIVVPFALNRAVSKSEIAGFVLKIKTVQGSTLLKTVKQTNSIHYDLDSKMQVVFQVDDVPFVIGQYYKLQLAFIGEDNEVGYFSTVGVVKCTSEPTVSIAGMEGNKINNHEYYYTGTYSQEGQDTTEKLYSSRFILRDNQNAIVIDSGEILHNISNDESAYEAYEKFTVSRDLEEDVSYRLSFIATTSNGLTVTAGPYRIMQKKSVTPEIDATLKAKMNFEDGYIDLYLIGNKDESGVEKPAVGSFIVCRAASNENYIWNQVCKFSLTSQTPTRFLWRDYTVEQGVTYKYSIQQYNDFDLFSERIESNEVMADFEDSFLFDGTRQLKIRYNPKVSSFKTDLLETKTDTIGSKHPFIFRNGNVYYKEFPISGLISYQMDDNEQFISKDTLGIESNITDFTADNILAERLFKTEVLTWLNNGEPKLFRSATEGNFIVRLLNNSLSPNDTLGRMLHTFSSTAYEIADFTYENLTSLNFIVVNDVSAEQTRWATVELAGHDTSLDDILDNVRRYMEAGITVLFSEAQYSRVVNSKPELAKYFTTESGSSSYYLAATTLIDLSMEEREEVLSELEDLSGQITYVTGRINSRPAYSVQMMDMLPGTIVNLTTEHIGEASEVISIQIGATGSYSASFSEPVTNISLPEVQTASELVNQIKGSITYSYKSSSVNVFDTIRNVEVIDIPCQQWIGQQSKTYYDVDADDTVTVTDLIKVIEDVKTSIVDFHFLRFQARPMVNIFIKDLVYTPEQFSKGVLIDNGLPAGIALVPVTISEQEYKNGTYYIKYPRDEKVEGSNTKVTHTYMQRASGAYSSTTAYYEMNYTYYTDMNCTQELPLDQLDSYYVYAICHGRFDYTYVDTWYEGYYVYANYNRGYYVDKNGKRTEVFTGKLLDGLSTKDNLIIYDKTLYTNQITINGETIDIAETQKWEVREFKTPITSLYFNNGVICEASYQVRKATYNIEDKSVNKTVNSCKMVYETYVNKLYALQMVYSVEQDKKNALENVPKESTRYKEINTQYNNLLLQYRATLGNDYYTFKNSGYSTDKYIELQKKYEEGIKVSYAEFIHQLDIALKLYREENAL